MSFKSDFAWADQHISEIKNILQENAIHLITISVATQKEDMEQATDLVIRVNGGDVAVRIRRANYKYRDLTIRSKRPNRIKTEIDKIKEGYAKWYLYLWTGINDEIVSYILADLDKLRSDHIFDMRWVEKNNTDNSSSFIAIPSYFLKEHGYLVAFKNI